MSFDTPLVEYLIIGAHTLTWLVMGLSKIFGISLPQLMRQLSNPDSALLAFLALPLIYLLGMLVDDLAFRPLNPIRKKIRGEFYNPNICKDELLAYASEELYSAYQARVRRIRILGAAVFNWFLIGLSLLIHIGEKTLSLLIPVIILTILLSYTSFITWKNLYRRAYEFRKNACDLILNKQDLIHLQHTSEEE